MSGDTESVPSARTPSASPADVEPSLPGGTAGDTPQPVAAAAACGAGVGVGGDSGEVASTAAQWEEMVARVSRGIVVMRVSSVRPFDGRNASFSYATGFVVDAERGIVLTNRHVVTTGPVDAEAIFLSKEEVELVAIYRDPVHDFGFFRYDPKAIKFMEVAEIPLRPDEAKVGVDIRVIGNDAGEKLSILPGVLARLDRDAPNYGSGTYNDFNTFYYAAASSTSGGSSGSPVLNIQGHAVALNAGGASRASSSFYLPLDRPVRALDLLTRGVSVPRGTLQTIFKHQAFDEVRRLGVSAETEAVVRETFPAETGMLTVDQIISGGPADGVLEPGDVLVRVNGALVTHFHPLEEVLDNTRAVCESCGPDDPAGQADPSSEFASLTAPHRRPLISELSTFAVTKASPWPIPVLTAAEGWQDDAARQSGLAEELPPALSPKRKSSSGPAAAAGGEGRDEAATTPLSPTDPFVIVDVERGGEQIKLTLPVGDLHAITPSRFLEVSCAVLHIVGYQFARNYSTSCGSVLLAQPGYMFSRAGVPRNAVITKVGSTPTPDLDAMEAALVALADGERAALRYYCLGDLHRERVSVAIMDRTWLPMQMYDRNDIAGSWDARRSAPPPDPKPQAPVTASFTRGPTELATLVGRSIVTVHVHIPYLIEGVASQAYYGTGLVVDAELGLVVCDRNTVPIALADVKITVAGTIEVRGTVRFIHPVHNFAVIQYEPELLGETPVRTAVLSSEPLRVGGTCNFVGVISNGMLISQKCVTTKMERSVVRDASPPRYRESNIELFHFDKVATCSGGYFVNDAGEVQAIWASVSSTTAKGDAKEYFRGFPADIIAEAVGCLRSGMQVDVRWIDVELQPVALSTARMGMGLPDSWVDRIGAVRDDRKHVLAIRRRVAGSSASAELRDGDLILAVNGEAVCRTRDIERLVADSEVCEFTLLRDSEEAKVTVRPSVLDGIGCDRVVIWAGMMLHATPRPVLERGYMPEGSHTGGGVYCSRWCYGSPSHKYSLRATSWVVEVNGTPTPDLDAFLEVVRSIGDRANVRVRTESLQGRKRSYTLKTDLVYWYTLQLRLDHTTRRWTSEECDDAAKRGGAVQGAATSTAGGAGGAGATQGE